MSFVINKLGRSFLKGKGLTDRNIDVVQVALNHDTIQGMADELGMTHQGVKWHLTPVYRILGVKKTGLIMTMMPYMKKVE